MNQTSSACTARQFGKGGCAPPQPPIFAPDFQQISVPPPGRSVRARRIAVQLGPQLGGNGRQHDAVNEAAHDLGGFGHGFGGVERLGEAPDLATIELGEVGMELQHRRTLAGAKRVSVCAFSCSSAV
jgi:hypothetical protein